MAKNQHLTQLDTDQVIKRKFDASLDADRVILVGGESLKIEVDTSTITDSIKEGLQNIKIEQKYQEPSKSEIQVIEKNVFIPQIEIKEIEKQVIVPQIEYRTIEVPIITEKIVTIEKPVIIKETEFKEIVKERYYPKVITICALIQAGCMIGLLLLNLLRKI